MDDKISLVAEKLIKGKRNVVFTGAGISTESGIPDYRSQGGIWDKFRPVYFDEFMSSREARIEFWRQKGEMYRDLVNARPNPGHTALAGLYEMGLIEAVITQNIDGLHQESGIPGDRVIELHGNTLRVRCMSCGKTMPAEEVHRRIEGGDLAPECRCGGYLKSDTISFGQAMPVEETQRAAMLSSKSDVFIVVGSTLLVQPASLMPEYAKNAGAFLVIINLSETPYDNVCDILIRGKAGEILKEIVLKHDLFLLSDEVYREFVYDGLTHTSVMHLPGIEDRTIMLDSVSKRYSACGARIGMIVSKNQQVIDACLRFGQARLCPPTIEQIGTEAGIDTPQEYFDEVIHEYTERRNVMVKMLREITGVVAPMPKGAFYLVVKLPVDDADKFAQWLLTDFNVNNETVMIAPANGFYSTPGLGKDEVRIAYVLNVEDIKKAMHILAEGLQKYSGRTV